MGAAQGGEFTGSAASPEPGRGGEVAAPLGARGLELRPGVGLRLAPRTRAGVGPDLLGSKPIQAEAPKVVDPRVTATTAVAPARPVLAIEDPKENTGDCGASCGLKWF